MDTEVSMEASGGGFPGKASTEHEDIKRSYTDLLKKKEELEQKLTESYGKEITGKVDVLAELIKAVKQDDIIKSLKSRETDQESRYYIFSAMSEMILLSTELKKTERRPAREAELRKQAGELYREIRGTSFEKTFFLFLGQDENTEEDFVNACVHNWEKMELTCIDPMENTLKCLKDITAGMTDREIIEAFQLDDTQQGAFAAGFACRTVLTAINLFRHSEEIDREISRSLAAGFNLDGIAPVVIENMTSSYKTSIQQEVDFIDYLCKSCKYIPKTKELMLSTYPKQYQWGNGRVNRAIKTVGYGPFMDSDFAIYKSRESDELDGVFQFRIAEEGDLNKYNPFEKQAAAITSAENLNEKYRDFLGPKKAKFTDSVINAIGAAMLRTDKTFTKEQVIKNGKENIERPVFVTPSQLYKYMTGDKGARVTAEIEEDIRKAITFCSNIWVRVDQIRGADRKMTITERFLEYSYARFEMNGKTVEGYKFSKVPAFCRYNLINGDMQILDMTSRKEIQPPEGSTSTKKRRTDLYMFLLNWVLRYDSKESIEYGFDKLINEALDPDFDLIHCVDRKKKKRLYEKIEGTAKELKEKGQIEDYEVREEKDGYRVVKTLVIYPKKKEEKKKKCSVRQN